MGNNEQMKPPIVIDCARIVAWASTEEPVRFTGRLCMFVDKERLGAVPLLVIGKYRNEDEYLLFHCDDEWKALGVGAYESLDDLKKNAEKYYQGISERWKNTGVSEEEAEAEEYLDELFTDENCSFCAKRMDIAKQIYSTGRGRICDECVVRFYEMLQEEAVEQ